MQDFAVAFALTFVIEGVFYALAPEKARNMMRELSALEPDLLRKSGLLIALIGVLAVLMIRG